MSAEAERARILLENAQAQLDRERQVLDVLHALNDDVQQLYRELGEVREGMVALSNRIEAASRVTLSTDFPNHPRGRGDTITAVPEPS